MPSFLHMLNLFLELLVVTGAGSVLGPLEPPRHPPPPRPLPQLAPWSGFLGVTLGRLLRSLAWKIAPVFQESSGLLPTDLRQPDVPPHPGVSTGATPSPPGVSWLERNLGLGTRDGQELGKRLEILDP